MLIPVFLAYASSSARVRLSRSGLPHQKQRSRVPAWAKADGLQPRAAAAPAEATNWRRLNVLMNLVLHGCRVTRRALAPNKNCERKLRCGRLEHTLKAKRSAIDDNPGQEAARLRRYRRPRVQLHRTLGHD